MSEMPVISRGLDGVYVDTTSISKVDGELGSLTYRDISIEDLMEYSFEEVLFLVITGSFPDKNQLRSLNDLMVNHSILKPNEIEQLRLTPSSVHPMKVLQGMIPLLDIRMEGHYKDLEDVLSEEAIQGLVLASKLPTVLAHYHRLRAGNQILKNKPNLSLHENFLYLFTGKLPSKDEVNTLNITQILQMEHGFNASTFSARVTASTLAPIESAISSAIGTLFGKLHGGADQAALELMLKIGSADNAEPYVRKMLENKEKIMGMGHRVYRVVDPRAKILKPLAKRLCEGTPFESLYNTFEKVEEVMGAEMQKKGKQIKANVEFYKAPVFYSLGIPPEYFTSLFAMSRVYGYIAHIVESRKENRLIRPKAFYISSAKLR